MFDVSPYVFGGLAAVCAEIVTFPVDTAKTRLQLQGQVGDKRWVQVRYKGTLHCLACIVREEGVRSVYKGLSPAVLRQVRPSNTYHYPLICTLYYTRLCMVLSSLVCTTQPRRC